MVVWVVDRWSARSESAVDGGRCSHFSSHPTSLIFASLDPYDRRTNLTYVQDSIGVHPNLIGEWKAAALKGMPSLFEKEHSQQAKERAGHEKQVNELYAEIGRLTTQVAWLKKEAGISDE